jgi:DNA-binding NarL/FixJ family response regulator
MLFVEDDPGMRKAIATFLAKHCVVQCAGSVAEALDITQRTKPASALIDISLPDGDGLDLVRSVREASPHVQVALISGSIDPGVYNAAFLLDAPIIAKPPPLDVLLHFVEKTRLANKLEEAGRALGLSEREIALVCWTALGNTEKAFAERLGIEVSTVKTYVQRLLTKTGRRSVQALIDSVRGALSPAFTEEVPSHVRFASGTRAAVRVEERPDDRRDDVEPRGDVASDVDDGETKRRAGPRGGRPTK